MEGGGGEQVHTRLLSQTRRVVTPPPGLVERPNHSRGHLVLRRDAIICRCASNHLINELQSLNGALGCWRGVTLPLIRSTAFWYSPRKAVEANSSAFLISARSSAPCGPCGASDT